MHVLYEKHQDWDYTCLVRSDEKAKLVKQAYPAISVVVGDLDSSDLLEEQAAKADIVLRESQSFLNRATLLTRDKTLLMLLIMKALPRPSPPACSRATRKNIRATGYTLAAQAF